MAGGGYAREQYYKTTCMAPAICLNCRKFLIKNYMKRHEKCPDCEKEVTYYNDPSVQAQMNKSKFFCEYEDLTLTTWKTGLFWALCLHWFL